MRYPTVRYGLIGLLLLLWATATTAQTGLLWKVEAPDRSHSYLFATMHSSDPRVLELPDAVQQALSQARSFTMEAILDGQAVLTMGQRMVLMDGRRLPDLIGKELYLQVVTLMARRGVPEAALGMLKPWAVFMTLSVPPEEGGMFLDLKLYQQALERGIPVFGLESVEEQIAVFDSMPEADQVALLRDLVQHYDEYTPMFNTMTRLYLQRDLDGLARLNDQTMQGGDAALQQQLMDSLVDRRNRLMAERMQPRLEEGRAFIAVGALHLPGPNGLIELLRQRGYRVSAVY